MRNPVDCNYFLFTQPPVITTKVRFKPFGKFGLIFSFSNLFLSTHVNVHCSRGQLAACRASRRPVPGAELPAVEHRAEAASSGARHAGGPAESPAGGSASGGMGGRQFRDVLDDRQRVHSTDVFLSNLGTVLQDLLELPVPGPQVRTGPSQK